MFGAGTAKLKEGYLKKYGNFVTRWRRKHFTLYQDGQLAWSDGQGIAPDKIINVRTEVSMLRVGGQVGVDAPSVPTGARRDFMVCLTARGKNMYILADSEQELVGWLEVFYHAKGIPSPSQQQQQQGGVPGPPGGAAPPPQGYQPYPSQPPPSQTQPPAYGFNPNVMPQPPQAAAPGAPYPQAGGYPPQQAPYPQQGGYQQPRPAYPTQPGGPVAVSRPVHQTVIVQNSPQHYRSDGFSTGLLAGAMLGGGYHGWGWGWGGGHYGHGWGGGIHFHDHDHFNGHGHFHDHDHFHDHHHDHHDFGGHDDFGGGDFGGGDFGGGDFGGGDFDGGGDCGGD